VLRLPNGEFVSTVKPKEPCISQGDDDDVDNFLQRLVALLGEDWVDYLELWYHSGEERFQVRLYNGKLNSTFEISYDHGKHRDFSRRQLWNCRLPQEHTTD